MARQPQTLVPFKFSVGWCGNGVQGWCLRVQKVSDGDLRIPLLFAWHDTIALNFIDESASLNVSSTDS